MCADRGAAGLLDRLSERSPPPCRERFIDSYRKRAPINLDVVEWFETLQYARCLAAVVSLPTDDAVVGAKHPFRIAAPAMVRQVRMITDVTIAAPPVG